MTNDYYWASEFTVWHLPGTLWSTFSDGTAYDSYRGAMVGGADILTFGAFDFSSNYTATYGHDEWFNWSHDKIGPWIGYPLQIAATTAAINGVMYYGFAHAGHGVIWTGGLLDKGARIAAVEGGMVLEMTVGGQILTKVQTVAPFTRPLLYPFWRAGSRVFASNITSASAAVPITGVGATSVFAMEQATLTGRGIDILYYIFPAL